jgi:hypothetical protein
MYEPTQRRVIDFYADLVLPFLILPDRDQQALFGSLGLEVGGAGNPVDERLNQLGLLKEAEVPLISIGEGGVRRTSDRFARPDHRVVPTTVGEYWTLFGEQETGFPELASYLTIRLRYLPPEITAALLKHATGERVWPELFRRLPRAITLNGASGTILIQPQIPLYIGPEESVSSFRQLFPPFMVPYLLGDTITLFSGQQLVGGNQQRPKDLPYAAYRALPFGIPLILAFRPLPEEPNPSSLVLFKARSSSTPAERIQLRGLTIADISTFVLLVPPKTITAANLSPEDLLANRQQLATHLVLHAWLSTWVLVDLSGFLAPRMCHVDRVYFRSLGQGLRIQGRLHWVDTSNLQADVGMALDRTTSDSTLWSSHPPTVRLDGVSNQVWFGAIEPALPFKDDALELHGIELSGVGNGLVSVHMETKLEGAGDVAALPSPDHHVSTIRIRSGSSFCHLGTSYMTRHNFPVQVEADAAAHLVRLPVAGPNMTQPEFTAGLLNHLVNAAFPGGPGWEPSPAGVIHRPDQQVRHALSASLCVEMPPALNLVPQDALAQTIEPDARSLVSTVADRTFAAGLWVLSKKSGVVIELRGPTAFVTNPFVLRPPSFRGRSNPHPGNGQWVFLSVLVHAPVDARQLQFAVLAPGGSTFHLSEPIVVAGAYLPPFSARITDTSGEVEGEVMPAAPADLRPIQCPGPVPGAGGPIGKTRIDADSLLDGLLVAVGRQAQGTQLHLRLKLENTGGETSWLPAEGPITLVAENDGPQTLRYRFSEAPRLGLGDRLSVFVGPAEAPGMTFLPRDLAVTLRMRRAI